MATASAIKGVNRSTEDVTWSAVYGAYSASYPPSNLKSLPLARVCRTAGVGPTQSRWLGSFTDLAPIQLIGICRHNMSLYATMRIRLYKSLAQSVSANPSLNTITATSHGLETGVIATLWSAGVMPGGLSEHTKYYVRSLDANTLSLHASATDASSGAGAIDISSAGSGTISMLGEMLVDSDWVDVWPIVYDTSSLEWEDNNWWTGRYTESEVTGRNWTRPYILDQIYLARTITIEVNDASNANGYVDIGLVELAKGWTLGVNFSAGAQFGFRIRSRSVEHWGGNKEFERLEKPRVFRGSVDLMAMEELWGQAFEDIFVQDVDRPFLWVPHPNNDRHWLRNVILARNVDPGLFSYGQATNYGSAPISIEEVL